jgi:hypothetical protein
MKRRQSGGRPGSSKQIARHHTRHKYGLVILTDDGQICEPTDAEMAILRARHPETAKKLDDASQNSGLAAGSWQSTCYDMLDGLMKQRRAMWFQKPVEPHKEGLPDYFNVIKKPMDLGERRRSRAVPRLHTQ